MDRKNDIGYIGLVNVSYFEESSIIFKIWKCVHAVLNIYNNFLYNNFFVFVCIF